MKKSSLASLVRPSRLLVGVVNLSMRIRRRACPSTVGSYSSGRIGLRCVRHERARSAPLVATLVRDLAQLTDEHQRVPAKDPPRIVCRCVGCEFATGSGPYTWPVLIPWLETLSQRRTLISSH